MALLKTGTKYPLSVVASLTYKCDGENCDYSITIMEDDIADENREEQEKVKSPKCPRCGLELSLISSHADAKISEDETLNEKL